MQIPNEVPHPDQNTPVDFSQPADLIIYVILPVVLVVLVLIWLRKRKKK